jgi:hypothetical protein
MSKYNDLLALGLPVAAATESGEITWTTSPSPEQLEQATWLFLTDAAKWPIIRAKRNDLLRACDWAMLEDYPARKSRIGKSIVKPCAICPKSIVRLIP